MRKHMLNCMYIQKAHIFIAEIYMICTEKSIHWMMDRAILCCKEVENHSIFFCGSIIIFPLWYLYVYIYTRVLVLVYCRLFSQFEYQTYCTYCKTIWDRCYGSGVACASCYYFHCKLKQDGTISCKSEFQYKYNGILVIWIIIIIITLWGFLWENSSIMAVLNLSTTTSCAHEYALRISKLF